MPGVPKIAQAKQLLVRYIHEHHLCVGDRLPSQDTFRRAFKFGTTTINSAISELKHEGILEVRDKVGVYVVNPATDGHTSYTIGLVTRHGENNLFYSSLLTTLQHKLTACGYMVRLFPPSAELENTNHPYLTLDNFPGLRRHIEAGSLNAIIHMDDFTQPCLDFLRSRNIPSIFMGSVGCSNAPNGVHFDTESSLIGVCRRISEFKPRHMALACHQTLIENCRNAMEKFFPGCTDYYPCNNSSGGLHFAETIISMPRENLPDWLIFPDDIVALAATSRLAQELPQDEIPRSVIFSTLRHQLFYPLKGALYFDSSLDDFVDSAISLLKKAFSENTLDLGRVLLVFTESDEKK